MKRTLNYTITINNPLIGKYSAATETQVVLCTHRKPFVCVCGFHHRLGSLPSRLCIRTPERDTITWWTPRSSRMTSPTTITSTPWTATVSSATRSTSADSGEGEYITWSQSALVSREFDLDFMSLSSFFKQFVGFTQTWSTRSSRGDLWSLLSPRTPGVDWKIIFVTSVSIEGKM